MRVLMSIALAFLGSACTGPEVKTRDYAALPNERVFEYPVERVWKSVGDVLSKYPIEQKTEKVGSQAEMRTSWIEGQSGTKYEEFQVNGALRVLYLKNRVKYSVFLRQVIGGTRVKVQVIEEVERVRDDGSSAGYHAFGAGDTLRASELLEKIKISLLSLS